MTTSHAAQSGLFGGVQVDFAKTVYRQNPVICDPQMKSVDHLVHEKRYITAICEQPEVNGDAVSWLQRIIGDFIGVEPEIKPFENLRIFSF